MTVFIVVDCNDYDGYGQPNSVWSTQADAQARAEVLLKTNWPQAYKIFALEMDDLQDEYGVCVFPA